MGEKVCNQCQGRGWQVVETDSRSFARRCECFTSERGERRRNRAGIPHGLRHCDLESFEDVHHHSLKRAKSVAREFLDTYPLTGATGLLFHGPAGTGKTHMAIAIVVELIEKKGATAKFLDFRGLLKRIQSTWNPVSETSEKDLLDDILNVDMLALDDLGAEKPSPWVRETVSYLINERYTRGKPVIITTNLRYGAGNEERQDARRQMANRVGRDARHQTDRLEDRIGVPTLSRLYEMCKQIDMSGVADYRRTMKIHGAGKLQLG